MTNSSEINRRDFLKGGSMATALAMMGGVRLFTQPAAAADGSFIGGKAKVGIIGLGGWGREILATLGRIDQAEVVAICDYYGAYLRRSGRKAPKAAKYENYKDLLADKNVQAVIIATPTHQHRELAVAAIEAGKHVYCEAPLANNAEDARAIAMAARAKPRQIFQAGLQLRADPQRHYLQPFIKSGSLGDWIQLSTQYNRKTSWKTMSSTAEREKQLNWRLDEKLSLGLVGEIGIHHIDQAMWFTSRRPVKMAGHGAVMFWHDGRKVPDTVHSHIEFPGNLVMHFNSTLASSFQGEFETYYGSDATVLMRDDSAWMFKEVDSPLLGWEVYAKKEQFRNETGIVLRADASKQKSITEDGGAPNPETAKTPLYHALEAFTKNCYEVNAAIEDFVTMFGADDPEALNDHVAGVTRLPTAGYEIGFQATVTAIKAAEAIRTGKPVPIAESWYEL